MQVRFATQALLVFPVLFFSFAPTDRKQFGIDCTVRDIVEKLEQLYGTDTMDSFSFARSSARASGYWVALWRC